MNNKYLFLINSNFITGIKSGVYEDKKGLTQLSNKIYTINNNIFLINKYKIINIYCSFFPVIETPRLPSVDCFSDFFL